MVAQERRHAGVVSGYRVTIRVGPKVTRSRLDDLDAAITELEGVLRPIAAQTDLPPATAFVREIPADHQIVARGEIAGPKRLRVGVDVRGDGSTQAFEGRVRRASIESEGGEDAFQALRRLFD
jgi:hypothetical protein